MKQKLIYIACCFLLLGCGNSGSSVLNISDTENLIIVNKIDEESKANMPKFLFENRTHNLGEVIQGEQVNYTFYFENIGKSTLIISDIGATCGCTTSILSKEPIQPGEKGEIPVLFDTTHKNGEVVVHVVVTANIYPAQIVLTLKANVVQQKSGE